MFEEFRTGFSACVYSRPALGVSAGDYRPNRSSIRHRCPFQRFGRLVANAGSLQVPSLSSQRLRFQGRQKPERTAHSIPGIPLRSLRILNAAIKGGFMARIAFYIGGIAAGFAAWVILRNQTNSTRRVPAQQAAAMLREAWADHHTKA